MASFIAIWRYFRGNDRYLLYFVIPAKAGIQDLLLLLI